MIPIDNPQLLVFLIGLAVLTSLATLWDYRFCKIPNKLTFPLFLGGLLYQGVFRGWEGLGDAGLGFLVGFGTLFLLWIIGGGGGGDAKLLGALSVWLGYKMTLYVLITSTFLVIILTVLAMIGSALFYGPSRMKARFISTSKPLMKGETRAPATIEQKVGRRMMTYALPITLATWSVVFWQMSVMWK